MGDVTDWIMSAMLMSILGFCSLLADLVRNFADSWLTTRLGVRDLMHLKKDIKLNKKKNQIIQTISLSQTTAGDSSHQLHKEKINLMKI